MTTGFKNGTLSVFLKGEIDHHRAASIREEIDGAVRAYLPEKLVLDFGGVTFCDSSGIAVVTGSEKVITDVQSALDLIMAVKYESGTDIAIAQGQDITKKVKPLYTLSFTFTLKTIGKNIIIKTAIIITGV